MLKSMSDHTINNTSHLSFGFPSFLVIIVEAKMAQQSYKDKLAGVANINQSLSNKHIDVNGYIMDEKLVHRIMNFKTVKSGESQITDWRSDPTKWIQDLPKFADYYMTNVYGDKAKNRSDERAHISKITMNYYNNSKMYNDKLGIYEIGIGDGTGMNGKQSDFNSQDLTIKAIRDLTQRYGSTFYEWYITREFFDKHILKSNFSNYEKYRKKNKFDIWLRAVNKYACGLFVNKLYDERTGELYNESEWEQAPIDNTRDYEIEDNPYICLVQGYIYLRKDKTIDEISQWVKPDYIESSNNNNISDDDIIVPSNMEHWVKQYLDIDDMEYKLHNQKSNKNKFRTKSKRTNTTRNKKLREKQNYQQQKIKQEQDIIQQIDKEIMAILDPEKNIHLNIMYLSKARIRLQQSINSKLCRMPEVIAKSFKQNLNKEIDFLELKVSFISDKIDFLRSMQRK